MLAAQPGDFLVVVVSWADQAYGYRDAWIGTVRAIDVARVVASWGGAYPVTMASIIPSVEGRVIRTRMFARPRGESPTGPETRSWMYGVADTRPFERLCPAGPLTSLLGRRVRLEDAAAPVVALTCSLQWPLGLPKAATWMVTAAVVAEIAGHPVRMSVADAELVP